MSDDTDLDSSSDVEERFSPFEDWRDVYYINRGMVFIVMTHFNKKYLIKKKLLIKITIY